MEWDLFCRFLFSSEKQNNNINLISLIKFQLSNWKAYYRAICFGLEIADFWRTSFTLQIGQTINPAH